MLNNAPDYAALSVQPGDDGVLWRLLDKWRLDGVQKWLQGEQMRATDAMTLGPQFGRALAVATMFAAGHFSDREAFIANDTTGVGSSYARYLRAMVLKTGAHKTNGGIIVPPSGLN